MMKLLTHDITESAPLITVTALDYCDPCDILSVASSLTWDGHDGNSQKGSRARDHVEDGEACEGSSSRGEEEAEKVHERYDRPAVQHQHEQHVHQVVVIDEGLHSEGLKHQLRRQPVVFFLTIAVRELDKRCVSQL